MKKIQALIYASIFLIAIGGAIASNAKANEKKFDTTGWKSDCSASATVACTTTQNTNGACTHNFGAGAVNVYGKTSGGVCNIALYKLE